MNRQALASLGACAWLAACVSGPTTRLFLLAAPAEIDSRSVADGTPVQLQTVLVPDYLDTTDILLRTRPHEIAASQTGRWGERLSQGITHALQTELAQLLTDGRVTLGPPADPAAAQLLVSVDALDAWPDGHCVLTAHWLVLKNPADAAGRPGHGTFTRLAKGEAPAGDAADVAAMAGAVDDLAGAIASDLRSPGA
jgi:uncharacterized lipoprotein YmbA